MATKKETKTTKKTTTKKPVVKKAAEKKIVKKIDIKKDELKKTEIKKEKVKVPLKERTKRFFNSPQPLFVMFTLIIIGLLIYIVQYTKHDTIMTASYTGEQGNISTIHVFANHKLNVFYATPAQYTGEDKKIYGYDIGYYYESGDKLKPFLVRSGKSDEALSLKKVVSDTSSWNISELSRTHSYFNEDILNNLNKLHFVVYASTTKGSDQVDYVLDFDIEVDKIM